jgi:hypothetical protein
MIKLQVTTSTELQTVYIISYFNSLERKISNMQFQLPIEMEQFKNTTHILNKANTIYNIYKAEISISAVQQREVDTWD